MEGIKKALVNRKSRGLIKLEAILRKELDILQEEDLYWFQRSREQWISSEDRNTAFYHTATKVRKAQNACASFVLENGERIDEEEQLKEIVREFYIQLFKKDSQDLDGKCLQNAFPSINMEDWAEVYQECSEEEVKIALFAMDPHKSPGPAGMHAGFFQKAWKR